MSGHGGLVIVCFIIVRRRHITPGQTGDEEQQRTFTGNPNPDYYRYLNRTGAVYKQNKGTALTPEEEEKKRRFEELMQSMKQERYRKMWNIDRMTGAEFEEFCAELLLKMGFSNVETTKASGDQGADITAEKGGIKYAVQCKRSQNKIGNKAVQEVMGGKAYYGCGEGIVITNSTYTTSAKELAGSAGIQLWDRRILERGIAIFGESEFETETEP